VMLFGIAWNMFGDSLNDVLDPTSLHRSRGGPFWNRGRKKDPIKPSPEAEVVSAPVSTGRLFG